MSLPHFSEESGSYYFLRKRHHKRDEAGYLFTLAHNVNPLRATFVQLHAFRDCAKWDCMISISMPPWQYGP
jgi:hypothetical protein